MPPKPPPPTPQPLPPAELERIERVAWPDRFAEYASGGAFRPFAYQRFIARRIAAAVARGNGRLIVNLPSRHGKSELCSRWIPTWFLDCQPRKRVIVACYGAELAENWGRTVRNEFDHNERLTARLRDDSKAANRWNTPEGGGMLAVGVGGAVIGFGGDLIVIDDPHKDWAEAHSPTQRKRVIEWFGSTLYSRCEPRGTIVLLMQRLHAEDLSGFLIEHHAEPWDVVRLPAMAEEADPMGRPAGAALCPERYDADALLRLRHGLTVGAWESMYQQRPEAFGAGRAYHRFVPAANEDKTLRLRPELPVHLAFDFNVNPGTHGIVGQYDPRADVFTALHEIFGPRQKTGPTMDEFARVAKRLGVPAGAEVVVFGDRSGKSEHTTTSETDYQIILAKLRQFGYRPTLRVPAANPPVKDRLDTFNDALCDQFGGVHYLVNPLTCPRLVNDLKRCKEDEDGLLDKSDEDLTHPSDAEGYRIIRLRPIRKLTITGAPPVIV
jgi:hypothetical protein